MDNIKAFLTSVDPGWNQAFANASVNNGGQGLNSGYMAGEIKGGQKNVAMPPEEAQMKEPEILKTNKLKCLTNSGSEALCFIYSILMGLTGGSENEVEPMVNHIFKVAGLVGGWISVDSEEAKKVIKIIGDIYEPLDVVVIQLGTDDIFISGRGGNMGGRTVVIRQSSFHYDAYIDG